MRKWNPNSHVKRKSFIPDEKSVISKNREGGYHPLGSLKVKAIPKKIAETVCIISRVRRLKSIWKKYFFILCINRYIVDTPLISRGRVLKNNGTQSYTAKTFSYSNTSLMIPIRWSRGTIMCMYFWVFLLTRKVRMGPRALQSLSQHYGTRCR